MIKFEKVTEPAELDFYTIFEHLGIKYIHILGYVYKSDNFDYVTEQNPNGTYWANMECSGFVETLEEFIQNLRADYNYVDDTYAECPQYQGDFDKDGIVKVINGYFNGNPADYQLPFEQITMDTPCGNYVV